MADRQETFAAADLEAIEEISDGRCPFRPVRHHFGITGFGVNTWTGREAGDRMLNEHDEVEDGNEELYIVISGRARFAFDGEPLDAPAGTLVFTRPEAKRTAFAEEPQTTILAVGGVPGKAYVPMGWEIWAPLMPLYQTGRYEEVVERGRDLVASNPPYPAPLYFIAAAESICGRTADAIEHLRRAVELTDDARSYARQDPAFDPIRDEPGFTALMATEGTEAEAATEDRTAGAGGFDTAHLVDLEREDGWAPIRKAFGIQSFGINAWTAHDGGGTLVPEHDERPSGHEELYLVISGHGTFTVDGEVLDAPAGTLVFVRDANLNRAAVAASPETTVISIGGPRGRAYEPRSWETNRDVFALLDAGDAAAARKVLIDALDEYHDRASILYNLACAEAQLGETDAALVHLRDAIGQEPSLGQSAKDDSDLDALRADPRFTELLSSS